MRVSRTPQNGWSLFSIGSVCTFSRGISWRKSQERRDPKLGALPVLRIPNVQNTLRLTDLLYIDGVTKAQQAKTQARAGCTLLVGSNGNPKRVGNCVYVAESGRFLFASFLIGAKSSSPELDDEFLYRLLSSRTVQSEIWNSVQGSTGLRNIDLDALKSLRVLIPPLGEQRKIAAILASIDNAIGTAQEVIDQVGTVKQGVLHELLSHGLSGRHEKKKDTVVGRIPDTWEVVRLGDVVSLPRGQKNPTEGPYRNWPLIAPNHVESGTGRLLRIETAVEQSARSGKYAFASGDVVYSKIRPYLRKAVVAPFTGLCSADMYPLRAKARVDPRFVLAVLLSRRFTDFANSLSTRTGIPKINREQLGSYVFAIPPAKEQKQMVRCFHSLDQRVEAEVSRKEQLSRLKSALMSVLLTGELRVTPDP